MHIQFNFIKMINTFQTTKHIDNQCFMFCSPDIQGEQLTTYPQNLEI